MQAVLDAMTVRRIRSSLEQGPTIHERCTWRTSQQAETGVKTPYNILFIPPYWRLRSTDASRVYEKHPPFSTTPSSACKPKLSSHSSAMQSPARKVPQLSFDSRTARSFHDDRAGCGSTAKLMVRSEEYRGLRGAAYSLGHVSFLLTAAPERSQAKQLDAH